jgi:amino acid adenylation domain-containing protein
LLGELRPPRDLSRTPFFSVLFNMMSVDVAQQGLDRLMGFEYEILQQPDVGSKFDVTMYVDDQRGEAVSLLVVYNRNLYDAATIEELVDQYVTVLRQVAAEPDRALSTYSLVTASARAVLPDLSEPLDATWHGAVPSHLDRHARERPDAVAVRDTATTWTYAELAAAANRLGRALQASGVGRGDVVAIHGHRCASLVWAMTGALASGAAYTILDPAYPQHRLAEYVRTVRPRAFVALSEAGAPDPGVESQLDELDVTIRISLPLDARAAFADVASDPLGIDIGPDDLACVTMTSGSTGAARAVLGRHGSLTHFLPWQSAEFGIGPDDRFSMLSGLAHDPIQRDVFWAIVQGASIVVPDPDQIAEPGWIAAWLRREEVTVAHLTPAMGRLLLETSRDGAGVRIDALRLVMFIGEPLPHDLVELLHARAPAVTVVNLYGTTETQRASGYHVLTRGAGDSDRRIVPLGRGIPGTQLLVRTSRGVDAGLGEVGEIWMRSHHLALGYLGLPDETERRFLPTPVHDEPTDRMYRTGDLGRYLRDGSVQFVGRADDQVQIRGFRVELGDVRAALAAHPDVADAVVVIGDDPSGDPRLVAYVVAGEGEMPSTHDLMAFMRQRVPGHMVPSAFVEIAAIPRTPNGKLDRRALPAPAVPLEQGGEAARDSLEHLLVELWQEVLGRSPVGIHDNFFDLGGYSLLATRLFALIEDATGQRIPVATLFQAPTIAELAETIRNAGWETQWSSLVPISPGGSRIPLFYVTPYLISVLQLAHLGEELGADQPLYGLQPRGLDGSVEPDERIEDMAAHYISEIRSVQPHGPYLVGGHCAGSWVGFELARQLEAAGEEVAGVLLVDLGPPGIDRPEISNWRYAWHRLKFFKADGRLWSALAWQAKIAINRVLLRRVGREAVRNTSAVQAAHHRAHRSYGGGDVRCDLVLIRTDETIALGDRSWFLRWDERTSAELHVTDPVVGIHSDLLEQPNVKVLAATMRSAIDALPGIRARAVTS